MIDRKNKYIRIRVIGGSGLFDSIVNILKKPAVSKLLTSAGKSVAAALGERLVSRMIPPQPTVDLTPSQARYPPEVPQQVVAPIVTPTTEAVQPSPSTAVQHSPSVTVAGLTSLTSGSPSSTGGSSRRAKDFSRHTKGAGNKRKSSKATNNTGGVPTLKEYVKMHKGTTEGVE
jgi:hypothetical protein